jgi:hypothetical protein
MIYGIYIDLAFAWSFFINLLLIFISGKLLDITTDLRRICAGAFIISIICTGEYVLLYSLSPILQNTLYVITYFFMLYLLYRLFGCKASPVLVCAVYLLISLVIAMLLLFISYSLKKGQVLTLLMFGILFVPTLYLACAHIKGVISSRVCTSPAELIICGKKIPTVSYMDTGNSLCDLYGRYVLVTDPIYAVTLLGDTYAEVFSEYEHSKCFDYQTANSVSDIFFAPVLFKTVTGETDTMPGFFADGILYGKTGKLYPNVTIAIAHCRLSLKGGAKLLANRNLKP